MSVPSQVFSLTTEILDIQGKTVNIEERNNSFTNLSSGEKSNLLISKKDDHKQNNRRRDRDDDDDDDDDDYKNNRRRDRDDDDDDDDYRNNRRRDRDYRNNRNSGYGRKENYRSSKYYRSKDWNCLFKIGRLVNSNQKALVLQLDILEKPVTRYANVVYTIYARQNNQWVPFYNTRGARLIDKKAGKYFLNPEIIEFSQLRQGNFDLSRSDLRVVTEINYDSNNSRNEKIVFEDVWNYSSITEINSITQLTNVSTNTTTTADNYNNNSRRGDYYNNNRRENQRKEKRYSSKAFRVKDWNGLFKIGRLVNSNQKALVLQLDILEKPVTRYANVVYTIYARQNNRWIPFYNTRGARLIDKKAGKYFLNPEVIEFSQLRQGNLDLSRSDLRFVTEISYDSNTSRNEKLVFENVWNYSSITEINSIGQLSIVNY
ncbi:hypothetical protein FJR05_24435 [Dolichospermum sp. UHCC 0259]|nr:hypothetical protein [Dolichospermum sp. UHCC 0259]